MARQGLGIHAARQVSLLAGLGLALLSLYTSGFGLLNDVYQRGLMIGLSVIAATAAVPLASLHSNASRQVKRFLWTLDIVIGVTMALSIAWFFKVQKDLWGGLYEFQTTDFVFAALGIVTIIELTRRTAGWQLAAVAVLALAYALVGNDLPGILQTTAYGLGQTLRNVWYSFDGVFGIPTAVVGGQIFVFFVFGALLEASGAGTALLKLSANLTGRFRGGEAHAAIVGSSLFGMISGSVAANVVGTGVFTIPMIRRRGFSANFAGGVEAAAGTGGQITPPIMGAAAFLIAELIGVPYLTICIAAAIPAIFYYACLFASVSSEAVRSGIGPVPPEERVKLTREEWVHCAIFVVPLAVIIVALIDGRSPAWVGFAATLTAVVATLVFNRNVRARPWILLKSLAQGGLAGARIMVSVGAIGVVVGILLLTGVGFQFAMTILALGHHSLFLSLLLTMMACIVLGMGLPTLPAYLIVVLIMGPALAKLGVPALATHLFVFYYSALSAITPPVAIAAFAAAPIADAHPMRVAFTAVRLAIVAFLIPFVFVYNQSLLLVLHFDAASFAWIVTRLALSVWLLATGFGGGDKIVLPLWQRVLRLVCAMLLLFPVHVVAIPAFVVGALLVVGTRRGLLGSLASQSVASGVSSLGG